MKNHFELTDSSFEKQFEDCTLNPELFIHEAHLRLAWIHIKKYGQLVALENVSRQLKQYVEFSGAGQKYNHTITIAAIKAVYHFTKKSVSYNFKDFISEFPQLKYNFKGLMNCHYQADIFNSEKAKITFIEPDLLPFE